MVAACLLTAGGRASAQARPAPLTLFDNRVVVSGTLSVSAAPSDDRAYYNLTGYNTDLLRAVQLSVNGNAQLTPRVSVVGGLVAQSDVERWRWNAYPSALYVEVTPVAGAPVTISGGIIQPQFGAFLRGGYGAGNLLIGYPLAYQYATSVRPDSFPASANELLARRGFGAVSHYSLGEPYRAPGLPLVNPFGWNAGVAVSAGGPRVNLAVALTRGGLANRLTLEGGGGTEASGRLQLRPSAGLVVGVSGLYGSYLNGDARSLARTARFNGDPREAALGFDAEYSRGYWLVRGEAIVNRREVPAFQAPFLSDGLWSRWTALEARYKVLPGFYLAARAERLAFSRVNGSSSSQTWDANVSRIEAGGGFSLSRNVLAKASYQRNSRGSRWYPHQQLVSAQVSLWF